jgi:hypothetical protein
MPYASPRIVLALSAWALLTPVVRSQAGPTTWFVGGSGPGHLPTIQSAIDSAAPGDIVLVEAGNFAPFVLDKGLAIVGRRPGAGSVGTLVSWYPSFAASRVEDLPVGQVAVLADMLIGELRVERCDATVVATGIQTTRTHLTDSDDVRFMEVNGPVRCDGGIGRLEITRVIDICGSVGQPWLYQFGVGLGSVLVTNSSLRGGPADTYGPPCFGVVYYVDAGPAIYVFDAQSVMVAGTAQNLIIGGPPVSGCITTYGAPGVLFGGAIVRTSGSTIGTSDPFIFPHPVTLQSGVHVVPPRDDPSLVLLGTPSPGAAVVLQVHGEPGDWVRVEIGRGPTVVPLAGSPVPRLVTPGRAFALGAIPLNGSIDMAVHMPLGASPGQVYWVQASAVEPSGQGRATNSVPIVVRR